MVEDSEGDYYVDENDDDDISSSRLRNKVGTQLVDCLTDSYFHPLVFVFVMTNIKVTNVKNTAGKYASTQLSPDTGALARMNQLCEVLD